MSCRFLHVIHLLLRDLQDGEVRFLALPHSRWLTPEGQPALTLPAKKTVDGGFAPMRRGQSLEAFVDAIMEDDLGLAPDDYALEQELAATEPVVMRSPSHQEETCYTVYPVDVWVAPELRKPLCQRMQGEWLELEEALTLPRLSVTTAAVFRLLPQWDAQVAQAQIDHERNPAAFPPPIGLPVLTGVAEMPGMEALARRWFARNPIQEGVRCLSRQTLDAILDAGSRALNLRVADPYLRYQLQGLGFTWSFFTHKDRQDVHVHGAPVVEIYGVLEGEMEIWYKPYYARGISAWCHRVLSPGDWAEVDSLQCHIVHWLTSGKGVVFKGGPGPLSEVGKLGVKGKTPCAGCPCIKPGEVADLEQRWHG